MLNICFDAGECSLLKFGLGNEKVTYGYEDLDLGRIHSDDFNVAREKLIYQKHTDCSEDEKREMVEEANERYRDILKSAERDKELRIWCASNPASQCGLFHTVHSLNGIDCRIFIVNMPAELGHRPPSGDKSWLEADESDIKPCLLMQREISELERRIYEQIWETLANENSELRVNIDGRITSVAIDYLDDEIISYAPANVDFKWGALSGYALQSPYYLSPSFVDRRIEAMITNGRISVVKRSDDPESYNSTLLRVGAH